MSLNIDGLSLSINGRTILDRVNLRVADGQRVGLIGSSGSGKSMIARSVLGTAPLTASLSGSILVDGLRFSVPMTGPWQTCAVPGWAWSFRILLQP